MRTFLIADLHLGHNNIYKFTNSDGSLLRPWANNADDGDRILIERNNSIVKPEDRLYILGDLSIPRRAIEKIQYFNGRKVLIKGNHDLFKLKDYLPFFEDIRGSHKLDNFLLTHIPIHPESLPRWSGGNIHGHLHSNSIKDPKYICVSVEHCNGYPIDFERIKNGQYRTFIDENINT